VTATETPQSRKRVEQAIRAVRREGRQIALIYAVVDGVAATVVLNVALTVLDVVPYGPHLLPNVFATFVSLLTGVTVTQVSVPGSAVIAAGVGFVVAVAEFGYRIRKPVVEQFEAANPELREALRTARDAVADGAETRMALALYEDVLERLRDASSVGLIDLRRLAATLLLVAAVSLGGVQAAVVDVEFDPFDGDGPGGTDAGRESTYEGLRDPDRVLGDPEDVEAGDVDLEAPVSTEGSSTGEGDAAGRSYDTGGLSSGAVESQQAGYAPQEELEDADLIREYNLRIRENVTNG
jgi:hypothetical protein